MASYYVRRSARDPAWRQAQVAAAAERERRRRELNPDRFRAARREATARCRERQAAAGFTFHQLWLRVGGDRASLVTILNQELEAGRIDYHTTSRRYRLNGGLPADVRLALRELEL